mgnify:CR=1 FL=1
MDIYAPDIVSIIPPSGFEGDRTFGQGHFSIDGKRDQIAAILYVR